MVDIDVSYEFGERIEACMAGAPHTTEIWSAIWNNVGIGIQLIVVLLQLVIQGNGLGAILRGGEVLQI